MIEKSLFREPAINLDDLIEPEALKLLKLLNETIDRLYDLIDVCYHNDNSRLKQEYPIFSDSDIQIQFVAYLRFLQAGANNDEESANLGKAAKDIEEIEQLYCYGTQWSEWYAASLIEKCWQWEFSEVNYQKKEFDIDFGFIAAARALKGMRSEMFCEIFEWNNVSEALNNIASELAKQKKQKKQN